MRAAVTERVGSMNVVDRPDPPRPGPGEVLVAPEAVGICGSDYHFFAGELSATAGGGSGGSQFPRVQGHEVAGTITALGADCRAELELGQRVALWPLRACGHCYPCSVGRPNTCDNFELIGIHVDGGLQDLLCTGQDQVFPIGAADGAIAAMAEPVSVAVRAVRRARIESGERIVVLGAGPIGQCVALVARERQAEVLVIDLQPSRLQRSREFGAETLVWSNAEDVVRQARRWSGPGGPPVGVDATGAPAAVRAMIDLVASAGRAVQVGMSTSEVALRIGSLTEKELDLLGVSCCDADDFAEAVAVVERNGPAIRRLVSHEFSLAEAPGALRFAMSNPTEVMKVVIWNA
ncbi:MAG: alcohol dehydrogenase catalytic domain-containing protein [Solirubrobacterales bacterium]|nr:alcohol dehydrogenase catalytic domain-containing protein [Solirubrobacterales bacterium]